MIIFLFKKYFFVCEIVYFNKVKSVKNHVTLTNRIYRTKFRNIWRIDLETISKRAELKSGFSKGQNRNKTEVHTIAKVMLGLW